MPAAWSLPAAFALAQPKQLIALVGGGGKTSLMLRLAAALPGRVVMTTTTRLAADQLELAAAVARANALGQLGAHLDQFGSCLVIGGVEGDKALGVDPALPDRLLARPDVDFVLVEADGARLRPIKAPAEHEPVIPPATTLLVPVAGIDALEGPLAEVAHRPEIALARLRESARPLDELLIAQRLTPAGMAHLIASPLGGLKGAPPTARIVPFINKVETAREQATAQLVAAEVLRLAPTVDRVVMGAAQAAQPVAAVRRRVGAVMLAAGESRRMGRNKLLLPWGHSTVLEQTAANVGASAVTGVEVITGHEAQQVGVLPGLQGLPLVHNPHFAEGMLSSVQTAVGHAPDTWAAILVMLGDQPMIGPEIMDAVLDEYGRTAAGLVVPRHAGQRGNPVLIDRRYFDELLALPPGSAPRALLEQHPDDIAWVDLPDEEILRDLDRPEDYARWRPTSS